MTKFSPSRCGPMAAGASFCVSVLQELRLFRDQLHCAGMESLQVWPNVCRSVYMSVFKELCLFCCLYILVNLESRLLELLFWMPFRFTWWGTVRLFLPIPFPFFKSQLQLVHPTKVALSPRFSPGMLTPCLHCRLERQFG